jgi:hypothetical protein
MDQIFFAARKWYELRMQPISQQHLGVVIAYILPGLAGLWGLSFVSPTIESWLGASPSDAPTISGFLYVTLASLGVGILMNCVRRLLVDPLHHWTGIAKRDWSYTSLEEKVAAIEFLIANQFRYYQFYGNTFVAAAVAFTAMQAGSATWSWGLVIGFVGLEVVLWLGSRETLRAYYRRLHEVLG